MLTRTSFWGVVVVGMQHIRHSWDRTQNRNLATDVLTDAAKSRRPKGWAQPLRAATMILLRLQDHEGLGVLLETIAPIVGPSAMQSIVGAPALHLATENSDATCVAKHMLKGALDRAGWIKAYAAQVNGTTTAAQSPHALAAAWPKLPLLWKSGAEAPGGSAGAVKQRDVRKWANAKSLLCLARLLPYADVDEPDTFGETAVHVAAAEGNDAAVRLLVAAGADPNHHGRGMKPVELAAVRGHGDVLAALTASKAQMTPFAIELGDLRMREPMVAAAGPAAIASTVQSGLRTDAGGWETDQSVEHAALVHACPLTAGARAPDVVDANDMVANPGLFEEYFHSKRPLVVRGAARDWAFRSKWTRKTLMKRFGKRQVPYGTVPYASFFNATATERGPLERVVSGSSGGFYVFTAAGETDLVQDVLEFGQAPLPLPPIFGGGGLGAEPTAVQFYLGGPSTGAPVHFHDDAWNALAFGLKRWFLWEPEDAFYRRDSTMDWAAQHLQNHCDTCKLSNDERKGAEYPCPIEFMQHPGDIVYVPRGFAHATLNIQTSVGFAVEFQTALSTVWGSARYASDAMKPIADDNLPRLHQGDDDMLEEVLKEAGAEGSFAGSEGGERQHEEVATTDETQGTKKGPKFKFIGKK